MSRLLVTSFAIWAIGCVVPTPLEAEQVTMNQPPVITLGTPDFLTPLVSSNPPPPAPATIDKLVVRADDGDADQTLQARLFYKRGPQYYPISVAQLTPIDSHDPTVRQGEFDVSLCAFLASTPEANKMLVVFVADIAFPASDDPTEFFAADTAAKYSGHFDYKSWTLECM